MGYSEIHPIKYTLNHAITYIINPSKTENGRLVAAFGCPALDANKAADSFIETRLRGSGRGSVLAQHIVQSFPVEDNITPEEAMRIGIEMADELLGGNYQYVIATHVDKDNIHNHIIFNNVSNTTYKTFNTEMNRNKDAWEKLRKANDKVCEKHNLTVLENLTKQKGKSHYEWEMDKQGKSWKTKLKHTIDEAIMKSESLDDFIKKMKERGVTVVHTPQNVIKIKFQIFNEDGTKLTARGKTLGWYYDEPQIIKRIEQYQRLMKGIAGSSEKSKIIDTSGDVFQTSKGLLHWAEIENMKEASKLINFLTTHNCKSESDLENRAISTFNSRMAIVTSLNKKQNQIQDVSDRLALVRTYRKYKPLHEQYMKTRNKTKFRKENAAKLDKFDGVIRKLPEYYPEKKLPSVEKLEAEKKQLLSEVQKLNGDYNTIVKEIEEIENARAALNDYMKTIDNQQKRDVSK